MTTYRVAELVEAMLFMMTYLEGGAQKMIKKLPNL
jgi:hypothetical protein